LLYDIKKEVEQSGYMEVPTEATEQAKNLVQEEVGALGSIIPEEPVPAGSLAPESSEKSLSSLISEFISNTIRARRGYRFVSYGSIALIVMLSVSVYSVMPPTIPPPSITRGGTPTQITDLTEQAEDDELTRGGDPDDADAHYNLGVDYGDLGKHEEAIESYKQAIRIDPDDADAVTIGEIVKKITDLTEQAEDDELIEDKEILAAPVDILKELVKELNLNERLFYKLYYEDELPPMEIAEIMGREVSTVHSYNYRIKEKFEKIAKKKGLLQDN
jgi:tetratricopeptide (TPR) repeat protein